MQNEKGRGMYIHIPFCSSKCSYCSFYSKVQKKEVIEKYVSALCNLIKREANKKYKINTIYIGGGTPSVLPYSAFKDIFSAISLFNIDNCKEITVECNPDGCSTEFLSSLKKLGVNRISIGSQSFIDDELKALGRKHTAKDIKTAFNNARKASFDNISLDLMLAIPLQTSNTLEISLSEIISLRPEHVSAYILSIDKNTVFEKKGIICDELLAEELYLKTTETLKSSGYEHYEVSNFALGGKRAMHNSSYWQGAEYFAFGCGAYGYLEGKRFHIEETVDEFIKSNGIVEKIIDETIEEADKIKENIMLGLRTSDGVKENNLTREQAIYLDTLIPEGFVEKKNRVFALTSRGFLVSNEIISNIF